MSKLRFRVVETAFKKKAVEVGNTCRTSFGVLRQVCIQQGEDVQIPSQQGIQCTD